MRKPFYTDSGLVITSEPCNVDATKKTLTGFGSRVIPVAEDEFSFDHFGGNTVSFRAPSGGSVGGPGAPGPPQARRRSGSEGGWM